MQAETTHVALSFFDWSTILAFAGFAFLLVKRELRSRDELATAVKALTDEVAKLRTWIAETYVTKHDHARDIDRLRDDIADHAERFSRELESHRDECPARRG